MDNITNLCIVGLGRAGKFHQESVRNIDKAHLLYLVDPNLDNKPILESESDNLTVLDELTIALEDPKLDAVIVSSPTQYHFEHIISSLSAGKHVFTEKPLGHSLEQIKESYKISQLQDLSLFLGFQRRYDHNFQVLKSKIPEVGPLRIIKTSSRDNPKPSIDYLRISGNIFKDMLIHDFDMLVHMLGPQVPESIAAFGHAYDPQIKELPDFDTVLVSIKYPDGLVCSIDTSRTSVFGYDQRIELFGENGMAYAHNQLDHTVEVKTQNGSQGAPVNYSFPQRYKTSYMHEIEDFIKGINNATKYNVSQEECLLSHLLADAAHQAATTNQIVNFTEYYQANR